MTRQSNNNLDPATGYLLYGYDYINQAWVTEGKYVTCGHVKSMGCGCYGRLHEGEQCETNGLGEGDA